MICAKNKLCEVTYNYISEGKRHQEKSKIAKTTDRNRLKGLTVLSSFLIMHNYASLYFI